MERSCCHLLGSHPRNPSSTCLWEHLTLTWRLVFASSRGDHSLISVLSGDIGSLFCHLSRPGRFNLDSHKPKRSRGAVGRSDIPLLASHAAAGALKVSFAFYTGYRTKQTICQNVNIRSGCHPIPLLMHTYNNYHIVVAASFLTRTTWQLGRKSLSYSIFPTLQPSQGFSPYNLCINSSLRSLGGEWGALYP